MHTNLLRSQKNQIFALANETGIHTQDFAWSKVKPKWDSDKFTLVERITHKPTGYHFTFDRYQNEAHPRYSPSKLSLAEYDSSKCISWEEVLIQVTSWLSILKDEVLLPDLWQASLDDKKLVAASIDDLQNSPFNPSEQKRIKIAIGELRNFLHSTSANTTEQLMFIDTRLKHLEDASLRLGRKDWITLAMGTLTNIVVGTALAPEAARELVRTAGALFGWVVGGIQLLL